MKKYRGLLALVFSAALFAGGPLSAATPEQEKTFIEKYKAAFQAGDQATLEAFLVTQGANPQALEFYRGMQARGLGGEINDIFLLPLTPEDVARANKVHSGPGGQKFVLPMKPVKKLKFAWVKRTGDVTAGISEFMVAEKDGKLVIPVPITAK